MLDGGLQPITFEVDFEPVGRRGRAEPGQSILAVAQTSGVELVAVCGGIGVCGTCRVRCIGGEVTPADMEEENLLETDELELGWRLACRAGVLSDLQLEVPPESLATAQRLQLEGVTVLDGFDPAIEILELRIDRPSPADLRSDWSRVVAALAARGAQVGRCSLAVTRSCSDRLRQLDWQVRVVVHDGPREKEVIAILGPEDRVLGLAVDIGTTKIAAYLVDLENGSTVARVGAMNPQIAFGEDVVSRIAYANERPEHATSLRELLTDTLGNLANEACSIAGARPEEIVETVVVGNTAMHHLVAGLSVRQLGEAPYVPVISDALKIRASELGLTLAGGARAYLPPNIAGYVGADHVSMQLACDLIDRSGVVLALDIGTNTEISLRTPDRLLACSCASGPAFEGAHIREGMRAAPGAVERVRGFEDRFYVHTVADQPALGICGSGILDAVAVMVELGVLDDRGGLRADHPLVQQSTHEPHFVLVEAAETGHGRDIIVSRSDVHEIQLAKAAIRAGIEILIQEVGLTADAIDTFIVAGAFGTYLDIESAIDIGMFPTVPRDRFEQVGNAAGMGAIRMLRSRSARHQAEVLAEQVEYVELTTHGSFSDAFTDSLFLRRPADARNTGSSSSQGKTHYNEETVKR